MKAFDGAWNKAFTRHYQQSLLYSIVWCFSYTSSSLKEKLLMKTSRTRPLDITAILYHCFRKTLLKAMVCHQCPLWKIQCLWSASSFWLKPHEPARIPQLTAINPMPPRAANPTQQPQLAAPVFTAGALSIQQFVSSMFLGMLPWWIRIRFISLFALIYIILFNEVPLGIPWPFHINGIWRLIWL